MGPSPFKLARGFRGSDTELVFDHTNGVLSFCRLVNRVSVNTRIDIIRYSRNIKHSWNHKIYIDSTTNKAQASYGYIFRIIRY